MDLAALSVASLSALFTAVATTAAWQAARVGLGPAGLIALQLKESDSSSAFALSLTSVRSSDGRRARSPSPIHPPWRVRPAPAPTPSSPSTEEFLASSSRRPRRRRRPYRGRARLARRERSSGPRLPARVDRRRDAQDKLRAPRTRRVAGRASQPRPRRDDLSSNRRSIPISVLFPRSGSGRLGACLSSQPRQALPQRGHGLRPPSGVGLPGVQDGADGPFAAPLEKTGFAGEKFWGPGSASFGGRDGLVCLSACLDATSTVPTGAWPSPTDQRRRLTGSRGAPLGRHRRRLALADHPTKHHHAASGAIRDRNQPRMALSTVTLSRIRARRWVRRRCAAWLEQDLERELRRAAAIQHVASLPEIGVGGGELCRFGFVEA